MLQLNLDEWLARRTGWPERKDFETGFVARFEVVDSIKSKLAEFRSALLVGGEGRGKTTTATIAALEMSQQGTPVWVVDCSESPDITHLQIAAAIQTRDPRRPLWIIEDCQHDTNGVERLAEAIRAAERSRFLLVQRDLRFTTSRRTRLPVDGAFALLNQEAVVVIEPDLQFYQRIVNDYVLAHMDDPRFKPLPAVGVSEVQGLADATGGNLRRLRFYLDAWNPRERPLNKLTPQDIATHVVDHTLRPLSQTPDVLETYVKSSALTQFDHAVSPGPFKIDVLDALVKRGLLFVTQERQYRSAHASDSRQVVESWAWWRGESPSVVVKDAIAEYLLAAVPANVKLDLLEAIAAEGVGVLDGATAARLLPKRGDPAETRTVTSLLGASTDATPLIAGIGTDRLTDLLRAANVVQARSLMRALRSKHPALADAVEGRITLIERVDQYARSSPRSVAASLYHYYNDRKSRHFARQVLAAYVGQPLQEHVEKGSAAGWGRLLEVAVKIDQQHAATAARTVAARLPLRATDSAEELSLLVKNGDFDDVAASRLVVRIIEEVEPSALAELPRRRGFSHLLRVLRDHWPADDLTQRKAQRFFEVWNQYATEDWISPLTNHELSATIWNFVLVGVSPSPWLERSIHTTSTRILGAAWDDKFYLLWNLFQSDRRLFDVVASVVKSKIGEITIVIDQPECLAVLGLLLFAGESMPFVVEIR